MALTDAGRALYRSIVPSALERKAKLLAVLTPEEISALDRAMRKPSVKPT